MIKAFTNIYELASDRQLITPEICSQNDFYGHATVLKNFFGWQNDIPLPFAIEHGAFAGEFVWDVDANSPVPAIMCIPTRRISVLQNKTDKFVESIGPLIQYASSLLTEDQINFEKKRLGKNLLVFPAHSTHHVAANYDVQRLVDKIKNVANHFDSVRVCLYWKDILQGIGRYYEQAGLECVTAGHIFDPMFLPRLKSLLTIADMTMSNCNGSYIGFSVLMGKPHHLWNQPVELTAKANDILQRDRSDFYGKDKLTAQLDCIFNDFNEVVSLEQWKFADAYWGIGVSKSRTEFIRIIDNLLINYNHSNPNLEVIKKYFYNVYFPELRSHNLSDTQSTDRLKAEKRERYKQQSAEIKQGDQMLRSIFEQGNNHYGRVILTPETLANIAVAPETWVDIMDFHQHLASDEYTQYVYAYYRAAINRFGKHWRYLDISNVLFAASRTLQPKTYLEIGVRKGRSACMVVRGCPTVNIVAFDMWVQNYAGMENPGEDFVRQELIKHGHFGDAFFVNGNSHQTIPVFFNQYPDTFLDMITVDGDHSEEGAFNDLCNVIPHLSVGGVLVFDDISHPAHSGLLNVWRKTMAKFPFLAGYEYTDAGFGVAFAIRKG